MGLVEPAALVLLGPIAWVFWRTKPEGTGARILRALVFVLLVLALAGPFLPIGSPGRDLVIVVDRSLSMPRDGDDRALELVRLAEEQREHGDRLGVVAFGVRPTIEQPPLERGRFTGFTNELDRNGSDLAGALELALGLVPEGRPASLLVLSDGAATTDVPLGIAQRALGRDVTIDVRELERSASADLAIERIDLPEAVGEGEPFQFGVWVRASRSTTQEFRLVRGGRVLSSGLETFEPGLNRLVFRDVLERGGVAEYAVEVGIEGDTTPENNRGVGAVLARGAPRVLLANEDGRPSTLAQALALRGVLVDVRAPEDVRWTPIELSAYRAVVLENVDAGRIGERGLEALVDFTTERGGGLLVTGGQASFGRGGYHKSAVDELLPVSMELRQEHRKQAVSLSIALDRSGSMSMPVDGSRTKMDLANAGAAASIESLSPIDSISVLAVDTGAHVIHSQSTLDDPAPLLAKVRRIASEGGGIYCYQALSEAVRQLARDDRLTKHIILFADASDADDQGGCIELLREAKSGGVTCSVIALGTPNDVHAGFLRSVATAGGGTIAFTTSPTDLPRLFAQETLTVARANFVEQRTGTRGLPGLLGLGDLPAGEFPALGGYNLTYLRPEATAAVVTTDDYAAPVLAFAYRGLGRVAAYTGQIGGKFGADVAEWSEFAGFATGLVRWLLGTEEPGGLFATVVREGSRARFVLEVDPSAPIPAQLGALRAGALLPDGTRTELAFERRDATTFEARLDLPVGGTVLATLALPDGTAVALPPASLPYSPEFEGEGGASARRTLQDLALGSGGRVLASATELFRGERGDLGSRPLHREVLLAALVLAVLEIALRRLGLWSYVRLPRWRRRTSAPVAAPQPAPSVSAPQRAEPRREPPPPPPATTEQPVDLEDALQGALRRARGRLARGGDETK
jgi:hypothetical protein